MARILHIFAHPGLASSRINAAMWGAARRVRDVTSVDLYAENPRYEIDVKAQQDRLEAHDVLVMQFPIFWYSCPALMKEWIDLVLSRGFAYGVGGDRLAGRTMLLAVSTSAPAEAFGPEGYQNFPLRTFLTPFEQTARLAGMRFAAPYVRHDALHGDPADHARGFATLLAGLRDENLDMDRATAADALFHDTLPLRKG
ncbi:NAD(P)H-dependent oxidoreductase [Paracoccus sp. 1_MG-2023]|uniref:NAD(P)H-dependent oxidoreductase n=1 Tax=unclassified Paracoccus (in: a-proteobacteria) TaxID=2688777 RepID=UPI001C07FA9B|nr:MULTISPECIES: NAD(P)H-dependent oxidoreductase [unclassified Paracoccus (in: a-proteobacteria)]MBU2956081.1 NAD(P)H-dependent oxidoreductase [Paracoccus sp. C2R09]MDO6669487.1 NAD(P)H-dependent oxidoreductase [Paracoccus sp. 1_MG-2023]